MKYILRRRPSPALVIACIALFVSLGGVSYGVATGSIDGREVRNNSLTTRDVRNNTLRTFDIRNNEVRGFDIRNSTIQGRDVAFNTLTGADVNETTFGKVPSATAADSVAALKTIAPTTVQEGGTAVTLATHGPLTLTGACIQTVGGDTAAQVRVQTTAANASGGGNTIADSAINPGDGPVTIAELVGTAGGPVVVSNEQVFASVGTAGVTGQFGLYAASIGAGGDACRFHGHVVLEG